MADEIDLANDLIDIEVSRALQKIRRSSGAVLEGTRLCIACGDDMPEARQQLGFKFCLPCALERERKQSLFADDD